MAHHKVVLGDGTGSIVGRGSYEECLAIVKMHKSAKSPKGSETAGAAKSYTIESDSGPYPLEISGAVKLGYTPTKRDAVVYKPGERPY